MLPDTIWTGPFWTIASIRPGGSGWITALITPPVFGSCASAEAVRPQARRTPSNTRFGMSYLSQARPAVNASHDVAREATADPSQSPSGIEAHTVPFGAAR